ncbi:MAG: hypothetical protein GY832_14965 [Chloroflexi bacterium]|nr:hypothetical protein [Chloroflexota bacterium]
MTNRLFDNPYDGSTLIRNVIFDQILPVLSSDGWKVLCVAIRQAWGGREDGSSDGQSERVLSISQFMEKTGIEEQVAIEQAIKECVDARYLIQGQADLDAYALNIEFEPGAPVTEAEPVADDIPLDPDEERALQTLLDFGREMQVEPDLAAVREAVIKSDADAVLAWIEMGRGMVNLEMGVRFQTVVARLLDQVPPIPLAMLEMEEYVPVALKETTDEDSPSEPNDLKAHELWQATLKELRSQMRKSKFKWLKPTRGIGLADGVLTVAVPNERIKEWIETGVFATNIIETLEATSAEPVTLTLVAKK